VGTEIWIDFSTAPDPLFFRPIARRLRELGYGVWTTAREYGETVSIAGQCGFQSEVVGEHGGRSTSGKAWQIARRAALLTARARRRRPRLALSFNSYAQAIAARAAGLPFVTVADYEYQPANHLAFRLARTIMVPRGFDPEMLRRQGAGSDRVMFFDGLKEDVTLEGFTPDPTFPARLAALGVRPGDVVVTMRPAATSSAYHRFSNDWFYEVLAFVAAQPGVSVVVLPRYPSQADRVRALDRSNIVVPPAVLDGLNLVHSSDAVISGGGSMNREAVVLGTPAYTVFAGRMAGVDRSLIGEGRMAELRRPEDLHGLVFTKKGSMDVPDRPNPAAQMVAAILRAGGWSAAGGSS
jgi:predicted glycosyltransferase